MLISDSVIRREGEEFDDYFVRLFENKVEYGLNCDDIAVLLNKADGSNKGESAWRKKWKSFNDGRIYERKQIAADPTQEIVIGEKLRELQRERYKVQTEKLEYNKWLREDARDEMFVDRIVEAIHNTHNVRECIQPITPKRGAIEHCLLIADAHFGKEFAIYGLNNEVLNSYSPEIFYSRMEIILAETLECVEREGITNLKVLNLGDTLDGFLRNSQIWTLRYGVVESAILYGKYMAQWLQELSKHVWVEYHPTTGNHSFLRLLDGKKSEHTNEDIDDVINEIIKIKNEDNPNFNLIQNKTGLIYTKVAGLNVLGIHGEVKSLPQAIKDFSDIYNTQIDVLVAGHKHHGNFNNCGYRKYSIGVGSIVGSDDFSMSLRRQADASANIVAFEQGKGRINDRIIPLN